MGRIKILVLGLWLTLSIMSCSNDQAFSIGEDLTEIKGDVIQVDTVTVNSYTIKADSIQTSGYNKAFVGIFSDGAFGKITASSYFKLSVPSVKTLEENARFDSICLILKPTGFSYGDTTRPFTINVHKLVDDLENDDATALYNTTKVRHNVGTIGSVTSVFKPNQGRNLFVRLSDVFGKELFDIIYNKGDEIDDQTNFNKYLKGFALLPGASESSILQFSTDDSIKIMRMYYHVAREQYTVDFNIYEANVQFNRIQSDYSDSPLMELKEKEDRISSKLTAHTTFCQGGTGVMTRLEFPYLGDLFKTYSAYKVLKAELVIKPVKGSYKNVPIPENLNLYYTNIINDFGSVYSYDNGNAVTPTLSIDKMYSSASISFDVTSFIVSSMSDLKDDAPSLLLSVNSDQRGYSLGRVILGGENHPTDAVQLKLVFWKY